MYSLFKLLTPVYHQYLEYYNRAMNYLRVIICLDVRDMNEYLLERGVPVRF
jgi:hypothetical protein